MRERERERVKVSNESERHKILLVHGSRDLLTLSWGKGVGGVTFTIGTMGN